jgi:ABC-type nitrate/sulfonate/bicarbonate transport system permease component
MEIRKRAFGLAVGLFWGLVMLLGTWFLLLRGSPGEIFSKASSFYIGYSYSFGGAIIGFIYGVVTGFIAGVVIAWFYEKFCILLYKKKS